MRPCEPGGKTGRTCVEHNLPLYPDGKCNKGRSGEPAKETWDATGLINETLFLGVSFEGTELSCWVADQPDFSKATLDEDQVARVGFAFVHLAHKMRENKKASTTKSCTECGHAYIGHLSTCSKYVREMPVAQPGRVEIVPIEHTVAGIWSVTIPVDDYKRLRAFESLNGHQRRELAELNKAHAKLKAHWRCAVPLGQTHPTCTDCFEAGRNEERKRQFDG